MLKELTINKLGGVLNQMYSFDETINVDDDNLIDNSFFDINSLFWSDMLKQENVKNLINELLRLKNYNFNTKLNAIRSNPNVFLEKFNNAKNSIFTQTGNKEAFFSALETLEMVCLIYTQIKTNPFRLSIFNGFEHNVDSTDMLNDICLLQYCNPYLSFVQDRVMPVIIEYNPDILWIKGRPNLASYAIAKLMKIHNNNCFIAISHHTTDFFSLNKASHLLLQNKSLFSVFDCVLLSDSHKTVQSLRDCLNRNSNINNVPNIVFYDINKNSITKTELCLHYNEYASISNRIMELKKPINIKLFPANSCYWNECSFCGINNKYFSTNNQEWDIEQCIQLLDFLISCGIDKFWALDEAVPPNVLRALSAKMKKKRHPFLWHIRTRIDSDILNDNLPKLLYDAGLRHILLGLESASHRILRLMNKTKCIEEHLFLAESIVDKFNRVGVHVHFPVIIGFPTESKAEREETYKFLDYLSLNYSKFSYNINIFDLDISSEVAKNWGQYNISSINYPCTPSAFVGNFYEWHSFSNDANRAELEGERQVQMKKQYPWYPNDSLINTREFFAMWEYSRNSLLESDTFQQIDETYKFDIGNRLNPMLHLGFSKNEDDNWSIYNFNNHQCITGGAIINDIIQTAYANKPIRELLKKYPDSFNEKIIQLINDMIYLGFFKPI